MVRLHLAVVDLRRSRGAVVLALESQATMNWNDPHCPPQTGRPIMMWVKTGPIDWIARGYYNKFYCIERYIDTIKHKDEVYGWIEAIPQGDRPKVEPVEAQSKTDTETVRISFRIG